MRSIRASQSPDAILALLAERAGTALACTFSSADEFEAAVIKARREAGAYGSKSRLKQVCCGCAAGLLIVLLILVF
jgi:hypothetical protein